MTYLQNRPSKRNWIIYYVILPLVPFFIGGMIRLLFTLQLSWATFEGSEISICLAILSFFVAQSLLNSHPILNSGEKREDLRRTIDNYYRLGAFFLGLFIVITILNCLINGMNYVRFEPSLQIAQTTAYISPLVMIIISVRTRENYRLMARSL